jgi:hypothetical protein
MRRKLVLVVLTERCYILCTNSVSGTSGQEVILLCVCSQKPCVRSGMAVLIYLNNIVGWQDCVILTCKV